MSYDHTKSRVLQWTGIILILCIFAGAYWYFQVYGSTLNAPQNDLNTNGLVGLWSFNGDDISGTTAYDRGTGGNNGTLTNAPQVTQGIVGQALNFFPNGSDTDAYVTIGDPGDGDLDFGSGDFSVGFWMKSNGYSSQGSSVNAAVAKHNLDAGNTAAGYSFYYASTNLMNFVIGNGTTAYTTTQTVSTTADNQWHQYTGVRSGSTMYLYIDGILVTSTTVSGSVSNGTGFCIGDTCGGIRNVNGSIDEVRVYNRAIAASEVASLYAQGGGTKSNTSVSQPQGTGRLDSGLAGYWKLDDGSGTSAIDSSTNGNTGTLTNGPTWTTGQVGGAVDFDGSNDYINTTDLSSIEGTSQVTFSAWVNADTLSTRRGVIGKEGQNYAMETEWTTGDDVLLYFGGGSIYGYTTSDILATGQWQLWTMVFDGNQTGNASRLKFYLNGVERALTFVGTIGSTSPSGSANAVRIGDSYDNSGNGFLDGKIDEVRIYNRALSADEVGQLYRLTAPTGVDTGLKGYWSFNGDDMSGTTAYDRSGAGNTGTLTNGPTKTLGKVGQALSFDGSNDYVDIANVSYTGTFTFSTWFYTSNNSQTGIIFGEDGGSVAGGPKIGMTGGNMFVRVNNTGGDSSVPVPTASQWHFMVVTRNSSSKVDLYIDGGTAIRLNGDAAQTDVYDLDKFGCNGGTPDQCFTGKLDEFRVYNRALSAGDVQSLYVAGGGSKTSSSISQPQGTGRLDSGLAGYWPLDTGSGTTAVDASTNGNNGTLTLGPTWTTGQIGSAVDFDGADDYITVPSSNPLDIVNGENFSISGWFNRDTFTSDHAIVVKRASLATGNNGYALYIPGTGDKLSLEVSDGTNEYLIESVSTFTATGWHHFSVVWNDSSASLTKMYIDGVAEAATTTGTFTSVGSMTNTKAFTIGMLSDGNSNFDGKLDEIRFYDRDLSADEVGQLYRLTTPTSIDTSLKGYWSFNGNSMNGTTAYDRSGAGNDGTLTNGPTKVVGKIGQGLSFDGTDDHIVAGTSTSWDSLFSSGITISAWVKFPNFTPYQRVVTIPNTAAIYDTWLQVNQTTALVQVGAGGSGKYKTGTTALAANTWYHIVGVTDYTSGGTKVYVNGVDDGGTVNSTPTYTADKNALYIGRLDTSYPAGTFDEIRVYNRALSASEITALYNSGR